MSDKPEWEPVHDDRQSETTRLKIDGGYLYKHRRFFKASIDSHDREWVQDFQMCFVPDSQTNVSQDGELLNKVAELSMKIKAMYSELREFEKQRINPKFENVNRRYDFIRDKVTSNYIELTGNIDSLLHSGKSLLERIEKLEEFAHKHIPENQWRSEEIVPLIVK